jgi:hypothetical protein
MSMEKDESLFDPALVPEISGEIIARGQLEK